ncbi:MAG TPA: hypothetical protein VFU13_23305 [Steroidobacteraceae bacterium]|nr:hypothetical protein [Steroidobacteraceae bacterium]
MSKRSLLPAKARVLSAALALREFTVAELAAFSGVKLGTVQGVIDRQSKYFDHLESVATGRRGGQPNRFRFRDELREAVEADFRLVSKDKLADEPRLAGPNVEKHFNVALASAQSALTKLSSTNEPDETDALTRTIPRLMRAARTALALAEESPEHDTFRRQLSALQAKMDNVLAPKVEIPSRGWISPRAVEDWQRDWTESLQSIAAKANESNELEPAETLLGHLLNGNGFSVSGPEQILLPAAALAARPVDGERTRQVRRRIAECLAERDVLQQASRFTSLVACAAVCGSSESLEPLLTAVTRPGFNAQIAGDARKIVLRSIARFARPSSTDDAERAALVSYVLLNRSETRERDLTALLPATVRGDMVSGRQLMEEVASSLYGSGSDVVADESIEERSLMRNLAAAFTTDRMQTLAAILPNLVCKAAGERFVASFANRDYGAIRLRGNDDLGFVLSPGRALLQAGDLADAYHAQVPVDPRSESGQILKRLILRDSATLRGQRAFKVDFSTSGQSASSEADNFIALLQQRRQAELRIAA